MKSPARFPIYPFVKYSAAMLMVVGISVSASAQVAYPSTTDTNATGLPSLPKAQPLLPTASTVLPPLPTIASALQKIDESAKNEASSANSAKAADGGTESINYGFVTPKDASSTPPLPTPTIPDVQVDASAPPPAGMPALPLPAASAANLPEVNTEAMPPVLVFPEGDKSKKTNEKTWLTRLAPSYAPPVTNFNYKRHLLSEVVYRKEYDKQNRHLPIRMTRDDYANLLFSSVASNNLDATRALLNAGVSLKATTPDGETPLMLAERMGATQVAALLVARGAKE